MALLMPSKKREETITSNFNAEIEYIGLKISVHQYIEVPLR